MFLKLTLPDIRARVVERLIFNFRLPPDTLRKHLPDRLEPIIVNGFAVASFCILDLDQISVGPVPDRLGARNLNCAHRFGAVDKLTGEPCVYVNERNTDSRLGSFITSLGFPGSHPHVRADIQWNGNSCLLNVSDADGVIFDAQLSKTDQFKSELFGAIDDFAAFMSAGIRSFCPAVRKGMLNIVDLQKEEPGYSSLSVQVVEDRLLSEWVGDSHRVELDCAVRTTGGSYTWKYCGQTPMSADANDTSARKA